MEPWVIGIDLGATKVALGLIDPENRIVARRRFAMAEAQSADAVVDRIAEAVAELSAGLPAGQMLAGVGLCSPGPLDHKSGVILDPPNVPVLHNVPLARLLEARLALPVRLEHDAKASGLGEYYYGAGRGAASMVYIVVGTGVGAAIIVDGQLLRGEHNLAGEIGHITIDMHGEPCSCGSTGCVETLLAGPGLVRGYRRALQEAAELPPGAPHPDEVTGEVVTQRAAAGDPLALAVMARAGESLGTAVATAAMILNIDLYVIGSSVAKAGDLLLEPARQAVWRHAHRSVASTVRIVPSALADDGPILGCGWIIRQALRSQAASA